MAGEDLEKIEFASANALDGWLRDSHTSSSSIWGIFWKKATPEKYINRQTLLRTVLRYGWVDSLPRKLDGERSMLLLSPRKPGSAWSAVNKAIIAELAADNTLHPSGKAAIDAAKADGSWTMLDDVEQGVIPDDLASALDARPLARKNFDAFPNSARRGIFEWIKQAKRAETRARRIGETAQLAARNERAQDWKRIKR